MSEDEAKTKWCPFVRYTNSNRGEGLDRWVSDRDQAFYPMQARCIGSECMAWRTTKVDRLSQVRIGHCGLAGEET